MKKLKYALFTGCTAKNSTPELMKSTQAVADKLSIELVVLHEASCCGATHLQDFDDFLAITLNARNIAYAEKHGLELVTICNTCQLVLAQADERLKSDADLRAKVNVELAKVNLEYKGSSKVRHFLYALVEDFGVEALESAVSKPMSGFNIAPFYGCHNIRPASEHDASKENPYKPNSLERVIKAIGANPVEYASKNKCCGFHADLQSSSTAKKLTGTALADAIDNAADMVVTPCPLCHLNMDVQQKNAGNAIGREIEIPVLHLPQMVGLALGITPKELGLNHNVAKVDFID